MATEGLASSPSLPASALRYEDTLGKLEQETKGRYANASLGFIGRFFHRLLTKTTKIKLGDTTYTLDKKAFEALAKAHDITSLTSEFPKATKGCKNCWKAAFSYTAAAPPPPISGQHLGLALLIPQIEKDLKSLKHGKALKKPLQAKLKQAKALLRKGDAQRAKALTKEVTPRLTLLKSLQESPQALKKLESFAHNRKSILKKVAPLQKALKDERLQVQVAFVDSLKVKIDSREKKIAELKQKIKDSGETEDRKKELSLIKEEVKILEKELEKVDSLASSTKAAQRHLEGISLALEAMKDPLDMFLPRAPSSEVADRIPSLGASLISLQDILSKNHKPPFPVKVAKALKAPVDSLCLSYEVDKKHSFAPYAHSFSFPCARTPKDIPPQKKGREMIPEFLDGLDWSAPDREVLSACLPPPNYPFPKAIHGAFARVDMTKGPSIFGKPPIPPSSPKGQQIMEIKQKVLPQYLNKKITQRYEEGRDFHYKGVTLSKGEVKELYEKREEIIEALMKGPEHYTELLLAKQAEGKLEAIKACFDFTDWPQTQQFEWMKLALLTEELTFQVVETSDPRIEREAAKSIVVDELLPLATLDYNPAATEPQRYLSNTLLGNAYEEVGAAEQKSERRIAFFRGEDKALRVEYSMTGQVRNMEGNSLSDPITTKATLMRPSSGAEYSGEIRYTPTPVSTA